MLVVESTIHIHIHIYIVIVLVVRTVPGSVRIAGIVGIIRVIGMARIVVAVAVAVLVLVFLVVAVVRIGGLIPGGRCDKARGRIVVAVVIAIAIVERVFAFVSVGTIGIPRILASKASPSACRAGSAVAFLALASRAAPHSQLRIVNCEFCMTTGLLSTIDDRRSIIDDRLSTIDYRICSEAQHKPHTASLDIILFFSSSFNGTCNSWCQLPIANFNCQLPMIV